MARIRTIKPELWDDESLNTLPEPIRLLFIGLFNHADDEGRLRGNPAHVRGRVFQYDDYSTGEVQAMLDCLQVGGFIVQYGDGESYIQVRNFLKHQRVEKPTPSRFPKPNGKHPIRVIENASFIHSKLNECLTISNDVLTKWLKCRDFRECSRGDQGSRIKDQGITSVSTQTDTQQKQVDQVVSHWCKTWNKDHTKFRGKKFQKRRDRIRKALDRGHTVDDLKNAITGFTHSEWHTGTNPSNIVYDGISTLLRDDEQIEKGITLHQQASNQPEVVADKRYMPSVEAFYGE